MRIFWFCCREIPTQHMRIWKPRGGTPRSHCDNYCSVFSYVGQFDCTLSHRLLTLKVIKAPCYNKQGYKKAKARLVELRAGLA
jgi:hypothetical protein